MAITNELLVTGIANACIVCRSIIRTMAITNELLVTGIANACIVCRSIIRTMAKIAKF